MLRPMICLKSVIELIAHARGAEVQILSPRPTKLLFFHPRSIAGRSSYLISRNRPLLMAGERGGGAVFMSAARLPPRSRRCRLRLLLD